MKKAPLIILLFAWINSYSQNENFKPISLQDGWPVDTAFQGLQLSALLDSLDNKAYDKIDGILIAKNSVLIFEKYFNGFSPSLLHDIRSATKSITSIIIGQVIDHRYLKSEEELIHPYFRNYKLQSKQIRIKDILQMRSGLDCDDWDINSEGNEQKMSYSEDWYKHILETKKVEDPGLRFSYCTGSYNSLGQVIEKSTKSSINKFAKEQLFQPLGIDDYNWYTNTHNHKPYLGGGLFLNLRDFAKFGQIMLDQGKWQNNQIISTTWLNKIYQNSMEVTHLNKTSYGLGWWITKIESNGKEYEVLYASGNGGQKLMIIKELGILVAIMGHGYGEPYYEGDQPIKILKNHLLN